MCNNSNLAIEDEIFMVKTWKSRGKAPVGELCVCGSGKQVGRDLPAQTSRKLYNYFGIVQTEWFAACSAGPLSNRTRSVVIGWMERSAPLGAQASAAKVFFVLEGL